MKAQYDKDPAIFLAKRRHKREGQRSAEEGNAAIESKKASKDKVAPKRLAGEVFGQLLAEKWEEIKKSLSADHKITDMIKRAGDRWKSLLHERQKMDAHGNLSYKFKHSQHDDDAIEIERCNLEGHLRPTTG